MAEISAVPAYMRRHGEFDPDPSLMALPEWIGIARVPTPFGHDAWLVTRHADLRRILSEVQRVGPPLDLVESFALPIPVLVIRELLGAPYEDRADFRRRSMRSVDLSLPPHGCVS